MKEYASCKCGEKKTYVSVAGDICCSSCFVSLPEKTIDTIDTRAGVFPDDNGWSVRVNGETKKYFTKYEDYSYTDAVKYANKLNNI
jgi:hypothetical protein